MKGYSHAITGAAAWTLVAAPDLPLREINPQWWDVPLSLGLVETTPLGYALGLVLASGAALAPDSDHHNGTIAHSLPKFLFLPSPTQVLCRAIGKVSGGHRHGTHSILGIIIFTVLAYLAGLWTVNIAGQDLSIGAGLVALFLTAFALKVFKVGGSKDWFTRWFLSLVMAGAITWYFPNEWNILPIIVGLGCLAHCLGDMLTVGGVPWLYPLNPKPPKFVQKNPVLKRFWQRNGWFAFPILGKTDSGDEPSLTREKVLSFVLTVYIIAIGALAGYYFIGLTL